MFRYLLSVVIVAMLTLGSNKVLAQQETGCLLPNGKLYYRENGVHGGKTNYRSNPNILMGSVFCIDVVTSNSNCKVGRKNNAANQGTKRTFYLYQCPLDDYIPLIMLFVGGISFFSIRKLGLINATENLPL